MSASVTSAIYDGTLLDASGRSWGVHLPPALTLGQGASGVSLDRKRDADALCRDPAALLRRDGGRRMRSGSRHALSGRADGGAGSARRLDVDAGFHLAGYVHVSAALFGMAVLLETVPVLYALVKVEGAAYLVWLGVRLTSAPGSPIVALRLAWPNHKRRA